MAGRSEHGKELQGFMKRGEFLYSRDGGGGGAVRFSGRPVLHAAGPC